MPALSDSQPSRRSGARRADAMPAKISATAAGVCAVDQRNGISIKAGTFDTQRMPAKDHYRPKAVIQSRCLPAFFSFVRCRWNTQLDRVVIESLRQAQVRRPNARGCLYVGSAQGNNFILRPKAKLFSVNFR